MEYQGKVFVSKTDLINFKVIEDFLACKLSRKDAALKLNVSERTITRRANKVRLLGLTGVKHANTQKVPINKISESLVKKYCQLYKDRYYKFNYQHALEMIEMHHELPKISYTTFRKICRSNGLGKSKKRRSHKARRARERKFQEGYMWQLDGSPEKWNGEDTQTLIALVDDATSEVTGAKIFNSETTWACMNVVREAISKNGKPLFILTDRAGWSDQSSEKRKHFSQFVRACEEIGVTVIATSSPESKGRVERLNRTFQDRLIPELDLYGIKNLKDMNRYIDQSFLKYWQENNVVES